MKAYIRYSGIGRGSRPVYYVKINRFEWRFEDLDRLRETLQVISQKNLPPSPPGTWLSRLPGWVKTWRYRERAVKGLQAALEQFSRAPDDPARIPDPLTQQMSKYWNSKTQTHYQWELKLKKKKALQGVLQQLDRSPKSRRLRRLFKK